MHIIAVCPFCQTSYQVQPTLRGQAIRCPNVSCRRVFRIAPEPPTTPAAPAAAGPKTPPPGNGNQQSGSVGNLVPILPAEQVAPPASGTAASPHVSELVPVAPAAPAPTPQSAEGDWWQGPPVRQPANRPPASPPATPPAPPAQPAPGSAPWWGDAPPPVRSPAARAEPVAEPPATPRRARPTAETSAVTARKPIGDTAPHPAARTQPMPALEAERSDQPRELPPGAWEAPPVRRGGSTNEAEASEETHRPLVSKRRARWLITLMILVPLTILGGVGALVWSIWHKSEATLFAEARSEYEQEHYGNASSLFRALAEKFPSSEHIEEYRFLQDWSGVCSVAADPGDNVAGALERFDEFISSHKKDPLMVQYSPDAGRLLTRLTKTFAASNAPPTSDQPLAVAERIEQVRRTVEGLGPDALKREDGTQIEGDLGKVRAAVSRWRQRRDVLAGMKPRPKEPPFDAIKRATAVVKQKERDLPGLGDDPEVQAALNRLYEAHLASVIYHEHEDNGKNGNAPARLEDDAASRVFDPLLPTAAPGTASANDPIVLALVRGVLYALKQSTGEIKWAKRVGIDTTVLPERVPARLGSPELLLVLSADTRTLTALDVNGRQVWEYHVGQPVLGRPVVIEQRAYLAAYDGWVHEIELAEGRPLGRFSVGQRLTRGGTREGDSKRIYFPADDSCIYVLDVDPTQRRCTNILYDDHPSGSLRSAPIVIPPERREAVGGDAAIAEADETPGYLILDQASGLDAMSLRVFQLPLQDRRAKPLTLNPEARLNGWTWFAPYHDGEKLAVLSDAGILGLFGIRQVGNRDQALFPWLQKGGLDLSPFLRAGSDTLRERGRSQVVHAQGDDLWILAYGRLQHIAIRWDNADGPKAMAGWKQPLVLGSPLHAPQRIEQPDGHSVFVLVTQPLHQQTCIASAVDDEGKVLWQRQLGLVFQSEPLTLTPPQGGAPLLLALDQGGGLFVFDPTQPDLARALWAKLAAPLDENPRVPPRLLPTPDGHSAYEIAMPGDGATLVIRHIEWDGTERRLRVQEEEASLLSAAGQRPRALAGTPALVGSQLIIPPIEGGLLQVPLPEPPKMLTSGPDWRAARAAPNAPCYVLGLGGDRFLTTDGSHGLAVWEWPVNGRLWTALPPNRGETTLRLASAIAVPPVLLPAKDNKPARVLVADAGGILHLLTVGGQGELQETRTWELPGRLTAAPFVRPLAGGGVRVGCILDERRLVWLDPERDKALWTYAADGEMLLGRPQLIEGLLVVALQSGRYVGLDPATGEPKGPGYTLRASAAPAACPVGFGPGRMLAPLSDGTALLLSPDLLRDAAKK